MEEMKKLFKSDSIKKNYRISFPNGEHPDITNDQILDRSVKFTESICSKNQLKFGLAESSVFSFSAYGIGNIMDCTINVTLEIPNHDVSVQIGVFVVTKCDKQRNEKIRNIVAYSGESSSTYYMANPVENAKFNGLIGTKYNTPYRISTLPWMYANTMKSYLPEDSTDYSKYEDTSHLLDEMSLDVVSKEKLEYPEGAGTVSSAEKYRAVLSCTYLYHAKNFMDDFADNWLFELITEKLSPERKKECMGTFEEIINSKKYGFERPFFGYDGETVREKVDSKAFNKMLDDFFVEILRGNNSGTETIFMDGYKYFYPYMNYSEKEQAELSSTIPYKVFLLTSFRIDVYERHLDEYYDVIEELVETHSYDIKEPHTKYAQSKDVFFDYRNSPVASFPRVEITVENKWFGKKKIYGITKGFYDGRRVVESVFELQALFGKTSRYGGVEAIKILDEGYWPSPLYPSDDLFPSEYLYPHGEGDLITPSLYMNGQYADGYTKKYGYVFTTYTDKSGNLVTKGHKIAEDYDENRTDYLSYDLSGNYIIQLGTYIEEEIELMLQWFGEKIKDISYVPFNIQMKGLPYIEAGDTIRVLTRSGKTFRTIVMRRTMSGIHSLVDNIEAK